MIFDLSQPVPAFLAFLASALAIVIAGSRLSRNADILADRTGLGEALMGALFLGACTSLPGLTASITAALHDRPALALSNCIGGIAVQTVFLAFADISYRRANLEHAGASLPNLISGSLLISLLGLLLCAMTGPDLSLFGIHPATPLMIGGYILGLHLVYRSHKYPMWVPRLTPQTRTDEPDEEEHDAPSTTRIGIEFAVGAMIVLYAGWLLTHAVESIAALTGIGDSTAGFLLIAITTSLPEMVTSIAAVRRNALTLAVGGILGGNAFDTLFAAVADVAYRPGSLYHSVTATETFLVSSTVLMTAVLLLGLLHRQRSGLANIGFESVLILLIYALVVLTLSFGA